MANVYYGLKALVQYRRKDEAVWSNMAAFDSLSMAEKYAKDCYCSGEERPWVYRAVEVPDETAYGDQP